MASNDYLHVLFKILFVLYGILEIILYSLIGTVKAILPSDILPQKDFTGDVVLITGSGGGLGREVSLRFAKRGAKLILWDFNEQANLKTKKLVEAEGAEAHCFVVDISDRAAIYTTAEDSLNIYGQVDYIILNAGIVNNKTFLDCPDDLMERTMKVNSHSLFYLTKALLPSMLARDKGHIVVVSSMAGKVGVRGLVDYCSSKFAAVGFAEALRADLRHRSKNMHVTLISPYYINTGMFDGVKSASPLVLPILKVEYVADRIIEAIATNSAALYLPRFCYLTMVLKEVLPAAAGEKIASLVGINQELDGFYTK